MLAWIGLGTAFVFLGIVHISLFQALRRCTSNDNDEPPVPPEMKLPAANMVADFEGGAPV